MGDQHELGHAVLKVRPSTRLWMSSVVRPTNNGKSLQLKTKKKALVKQAHDLIKLYNRRKLGGYRLKSWSLI